MPDPKGKDTLIIAGQVRKGRYFDSVTLMNVARELNQRRGIIEAALVMGSAENKALLTASGLSTAAFRQSSDSDLLVAVKATGRESADAALAAVDEYLERLGKRSANRREDAPGTIDAALQILPEANLALISVPGRYAAFEARKALDQGLHVMLFSDNVPLEEEVALKKLAVERNLLMMGPDCGSAIINGVPLGFANVVNRGDIGIVGASGTGLQEASVIISNHGAGISQAIGTGGRDVKKEVGGIMFLSALQALAADQDTSVILLIAKPPDSEVLKKLRTAIGELQKPTVSLFLGGEASSGPPNTLEAAALQAVALSKGEEPAKCLEELQQQENELKKIARQKRQNRRAAQKFIRGLFSGGTLCTEAQVILQELLPELYSNVPTGRAKKLSDSFHSQQHTVIDLGDDEFTAGRPHPMIDYSLRNQRILREAADPQTAVILLDVVLGYGAHPDPAAELIPVIREAKRKVAVICSVTGTDRDPQHRAAVVKALQEAGALLLPTNAAACKLAGYLVQALHG